MTRPGPRRRIALLAGVTLLSLAPSYSPAVAEGDAPRRVKLGAVNTFTSSTISGIRVRIPAPASFPVTGENPYVRVDGVGRMAGYVLVQEGVRVGDRISRMTTYSRFCDDPGCDEGEPFVWHGGTKVPVDRETRVGTLPAGDYILYVIADQAPVTVTLEFDGLTGTRNVHLTKPADGAIMLPRVRLSAGPEKNVYSFGEEFDVSGSSSIAIPMMRFRTGEAYSMRHEVCAYRGDPAVPDPVAYAPGCPAAEFGLSVNQFDFIAHRVFVHGYYIQSGGAGRRGYGLNYVVTGEVYEPDSLYFYVDGDVDELQG